MSNLNYTKLIFSEIKNHYKIKNDAELARFLGIASTTLASWYKRNSFDLHLVYSKCEEIDGNWLLSGKGNIIRNSINFNSQLNEVSNSFSGDVTDWKKEYFKEKEKFDDLNKKYIQLLERLIN